MEKIAAIVKSGQDTKSYSGLLNNRPDYMLPFGARYRLIDTTLSNLSESGLHKVLLQGGINIRSTLDHVGNGEHWDMDLRENGLVISVPSKRELESNNRRMYSYYDSIPFVESDIITTLYIANPMLISKVNIEEAYEKFKHNNYDVMFLYKTIEDPSRQYLNSRKVIFDDEGNVQNIGTNLGTEDVFNLFVDHIFIKKDLFKEIVTDSIEKDNAYTLTQAIMRRKDDLKIGTYELTEHIEFIQDTNTFYNANMNLLNKEVYDDMFLSGAGVLTKNKDEPSTNYGLENTVKNCLLANGSVIYGNIYDSILFRQVKVAYNATVKDSIVFQGCVIEEGAYVENAILDKNVVVKSGVSIIGTKNNPIVVEKNKVLEK